MVRNIRELVINGRRARRASSLAEFLDVSADGSKNVWFESGQTVTLAPVPAVTVITTATLHYLQVETTLLTDLNTPLLPDQHIPTLIARAAYHANIRRANYEAATQDQGEYMEHVKKMKTSYPTRSGPRQIRPSGVTPWAGWG